MGEGNAYNIMGGDPTPAERRAEFSETNPRLRLSVISYLLESGVKPDPNGYTVEQFTTICDTILQWATAKTGEHYPDPKPKLNPLTDNDFMGGYI